MIRSLAKFGTPLVLGLGLHISACSPSTPPGSAGESQGVLTLGLLPDENHLVQHVHYGPLADAIKSSTGFDVRLLTPHSYEELVAAFSRGDIDAAYFGGYIPAAHRFSASIARTLTRMAALEMLAVVEL